MYADIPQLQSAPSLTSTTNAVMVSWSPAEFTPDSYRISYSCQLICESSVTHQTVTTVNAPFYYIQTISSVDPGNSCVVNVTAVFGNRIISNTVTSSTNTRSAGIVCTTHPVVTMVNFMCITVTVFLFPSPY